MLSDKGAKLKLFDPKADYNELESTDGFTIADSVEEVSWGAALIVLLTEWNEFKTFELAGDSRSNVLVVSSLIRRTFWMKRR